MIAAQEGQIFADRYQLVSHLSTGGFSKVYRGVQLGVDRPVAIKILDPLDSKATNVEARFYLEAKLISQLKDPHTITMHDYGKEGENLYMVFEFVDGRDLSEELQRGSLSPARTIKVMEQVLRSLDEAHTLNVVHRDLKPSNVMIYDHLTRQDCVKVLDFGIAKTLEEESGYDSGLTAEGVLVGTPRYMAPEQIALRKLSPASDVYSLGLLWLEMLTGVRPFNSLSVREMMEFKLKNDIPVPGKLPDGIAALLTEMLRKDPERRVQNAGAVLQRIRELDPDTDSVENVVVFPLGLDSTGTLNTADITGLSQIDASYETVADLGLSERPKPPLWPALVGGLVILALIAAAAFFTRDVPVEKVEVENVPPKREVAIGQSAVVAPAPKTDVKTLGAVVSAKTHVVNATRLAQQAELPKRAQPEKKTPTRRKKSVKKQTFNPGPVD